MNFEILPHRKIDNLLLLLLLFMLNCHLNIPLGFHIIIPIISFLLYKILTPLNLILLALGELNGVIISKVDNKLVLHFLEYILLVNLCRAILSQLLEYITVIDGVDESGVHLS